LCRRGGDFWLGEARLCQRPRPQRHSIFRGSIAYPTQLLCTLRSGRHLPPRNTRYQAAATPYLSRTCTGWNTPACLAHGHDTYCSNFSCLALTLAAGRGPGARRAMGRPSKRSSPVTNSAAPMGRPVPSARRSARNASSRSSRSRSAKQDTRSSTGRTVTNRSSTPARWARTLGVSWTERAGTFTKLPSTKLP
jgi:hypothetical protein